MIGDFLSHLLGEAVGETFRALFSLRSQPMALPSAEEDRSLLGGIAVFVAGLGLGISAPPILAMLGFGAQDAPVVLGLGLGTLPCVAAALVARRALRLRNSWRTLAWIGLWTSRSTIAANVVGFIAWAVLR